MGILRPNTGNRDVSQALTQIFEAYFDEALEQAFWIVDRPWFEERLLAHWNGSKSDDTTWFALRNVVWALGSRIALSKNSGYRFAMRSSWAFFEKVLSVQVQSLECFLPVFGELVRGQPQQDVIQRPFGRKFGRDAVRGRLTRCVGRVRGGRHHSLMERVRI